MISLGATDTLKRELPRYTEAVLLEFNLQVSAFAVRGIKCIAPKHFQMVSSRGLWLYYFRVNRTV